jgi:predicted phage terminase large subunit-like protein
MARKTKPNDPLIDQFDHASAQAEKGKRCTLSFDQFFRTYPPSPDYLFGKHTIALIKELQIASETVERGECYYAVINMPPRHGKSDVCSRRYPAWHMSRNPDHEVILVTYGADLSLDLAHDVRKCFSEAGQHFGLRLSEDRNTLGAWRIEGHRGGMMAVGIGGAITGRGGSIIVIDDYCKNRAEAESETIRQSTWASFQSDIITRGAPAHAIIVVATPWHPDDLTGRIFVEMEKNPEFPQFKRIRFPAQAEDGSWLFPERFTEKYYKAQKAFAGPYAWEALYQCDPKPRTGHFLRSDLVTIIDAIPETMRIEPEDDDGEAKIVKRNLKYVRSWDLASSEKERVKDDPDYTVGTKVAYDGTNYFIVDVIRGQWTATERDNRIVAAAKLDGPRCTVKIETVAGYKDTFVRIKNRLRGKSTVRNSTPHLDKVARASLVEPAFEGKCVFLLRAPWNDDWITEASAFPRGKHDDQIDSFVIGAEELTSSRRRMGLSR